MIFFQIIALFLPTLLFSSSSDLLEFGALWSIIKPLEMDGTLQDLMKERAYEIETLKEEWRFFISEEEFHHQAFLSDFCITLSEGHLELEKEGAGAAYILYDLFHHPKFVIKPLDEDIFCLHNPKHFASPFKDLENRVKKEIPLYRSSQTNALCYEIAKLCHLEHTTPETILAILAHPQFFYISNDLIISLPHEKLCSIQTYLQNTLSLRSVLEKLFSLGLSEEELKEHFDQEDFEDVNLLIWLTYDNDAHPENFRVYPKRVNDKEEIVYGIRKIDNSLSFPENNAGFLNSLMYFPNALEPLSERTRAQIAALPTEEIEKHISKYGLDSSSFAFHQRVSILQKLIEKENISYYECSLRLSLLEKAEGVELALSDHLGEYLEIF